MAAKPAASTVNPLDTVHMLLKMIQDQAPPLETSVTNADGTLNKSAGEGAAPIPNNPAPSVEPAQVPAPKQKQNLQAFTGPDALTSAILNIGQIMPVVKPQLPQGSGLSELLGGKSTSATDTHSNGAAVIQTAAKLLKFLG